MEIKDIIKELRNTLKLNQAELAKKLGINQATVSRWESGASFPSPLANMKLSRLVERARKKVKE